MVRKNDKTFETLKSVFSNPIVTGGMALLSLALIPVGLAMQSATPERRARFKRRMAQQQEDRERVRRNHDRWSRRTRHYNDYFSNGEGYALMRERAYVEIGPQQPFPDAVYERKPAGFRQSSFGVSSPSASASVIVSWDVADRDGGISLTKPDGARWGLGIYTGQTSLAQYEPGKPLDVDAATLACRLLATDGSPFKTITLTRPEYHAIKEAIWRDHMLASPELAKDLGWWPTKEEERAHQRAELTEVAERRRRNR